MLRQKNPNILKISSPKLSPIAGRRVGSVNPTVSTPFLTNNQNSHTSNRIRPKIELKNLEECKTDDPWGIVNAFKNHKPNPARQQKRKVSENVLESDATQESSGTSVDSWEVYIPGTVPPASGTVADSVIKPKKASRQKRLRGK